MLKISKAAASKSLRFFFANSRFKRAYKKYIETGKSPLNAENLLHFSTWKSSGTFPRKYSLKFANQEISDLISESRNHYFKDLDPVLAASEIDENGFYLIPELLPDELVDSLLTHLEEGPTHPRGMEVTDFTPNKPNPKSPTWWMRTDQIMNSVQVQHLLLEENLIRTASLYLKSKPRIMSLAMWKSYSGFGTDANASQKFHFDNDRANFLKLFIYLTIVTDKNGPHTYIKKSHNEKPKSLLHGEKLEDLDISSYYPEDDQVVITGLKGQAFFADTAGFHKGTKVISDARAIFQINYSSDNFGTLNKDLAATLGEALVNINKVDGNYLEAILDKDSEI